jgi:hypothetical protein
VHWIEEEDEVIVAWVLSVQMWAFHNITSIQMEGGKSDSKPTHPISKWVV